MKPDKIEPCTGKVRPSFSNCHVGLYQSPLSLSPSLWVWIGTWGGKLTEWTPCLLTVIGETRWTGGLTQDWAVLLVSEHLKVWGLCEMAPGVPPPPNKSTVARRIISLPTICSFCHLLFLLLHKWIQNWSAKALFPAQSPATIHQDQLLFWTVHTAAASIRLPVPEHRKLRSQRLMPTSDLQMRAFEVPLRRLSSTRGLLEQRGFRKQLADGASLCALEHRQVSTAQRRSGSN